MKLGIDKFIFKFNLVKSFKSLFNWLWLFFCLVMYTIVAFTFFISSVQWAMALIILFVIAITGVSVFNVVNLNKIFSVDYEMGIMNLELRKGKNKNSIFFSRLLINKIWTISFSLMFFIVLIISTSLMNKNELNNWPFIIFLMIPLDFLLTAIYLFFFSLFKPKAAIATSILMAVLIVISSFSNFVVAAFQNNDRYIRNSVESAESAYLANEVFSIIEKYGNNSTLYKFVYESNTWTDFVVSSSLYYGNSTSLSSSGILNYNDIDGIRKLSGSTTTTEFSNDFKKSILFKINNDNKFLISTDKSSDFAKSIFNTDLIYDENADYTINKLDNVINLINQSTDVLNPDADPNDNSMQDFNSLIRDYAFYNIKQNGDISARDCLQPTYWENFEDYSISTFYSDNFFNLKERYTDVGLMAWNKIATNLVVNVRLIQDLPTNVNSLWNYLVTYFFPLVMTSQTITSPNDFIKPLHYLIDAKNDATDSPLVIYTNGPKWKDPNAKSDTFSATFSYTKSQNKKPYEKTYSVFGYEAFLLVSSVLVITWAYFMYSKRIKI